MALYKNPTKYKKNLVAGATDLENKSGTPLNTRKKMLPGLVSKNTSGLIQEQPKNTPDQSGSQNASEPSIVDQTNNRQVAQNLYQSEDVTSIQDQAKSILNKARGEKRDFEKELFGEAITAKTQEEEIDLFLKDQEEEKTRLQRQIDQMNEVDQSNFDMYVDKAGAAKSATAANFAQGREGVMSATNPMISKQFSKNVDQEVTNRQTQLNIQMENRADLIKKLDSAQKLKRSELAESISDKLADVENNIRQEKLRMAELADHARTQAFDFLEKAPAGSLAGMDVQMVAQSFGVDGMTASVLVNMDQQKSALQDRQTEMDALEYATKMSQIEKNIAETKWAGMTTEQKNFEYYKGMIGHDPEGAKQFAEATGLIEKSFFQDFDEEWVTNVQKTEAIYEKTGVKAPLRSKYAYEITPDGAVSFEKSAPSGTRLTSRGECGMFVNDIINGGSGLFGNSFEDKMSKVNSSEPVAGAAFVEKIGGWTGHVGVVEKVYKDDAGQITGFDIRESNYVDTWTVSTAHITPGSSRWNTIVGSGGFYVPGSDRARDEVIETQVGEVQTTEQQVNSVFGSFAKSLADGDLEIGDLKEMGMSKSDIAMLQTAAFQLKGDAPERTQEEMMVFAQGLADGKVKLSDLESMGFKEDELRMLQGAAIMSGPSSSASQDELMNYAQGLASGRLNVSDLKSMGLNEDEIRALSNASLMLPDTSKSSSGSSGGYGINPSDDARMAAEIILGSGGSMTIEDIPQKDRIAVQGYINELQNDPSFSQGGSDTVRQAAEAIFNGSSTLTLNQLPQAMRIDVETELGKMRKEAIDSGDIEGIIRASAGGKDLSETTLQRFEKTSNVIFQVDQLQDMLSQNKRKLESIDAGPIWGFFKKKNPWSTDAQELNAVLQGTIPNLARGVFGEVGVLTDRDIELYRKTLPNLQQTEDVQKSVTALTLRTLRNSMENQIKIQAGGGRDVSGLLPFYTQIDQVVNQMESELGIQDKKSSINVAKATQNIFSGITSGIKSILGTNEKAPSNPFDDIDLGNDSDPYDLLNQF